MAKLPKRPIEVEKVSRNVINIRIEVKGEEWEQWFLLSGDRHHDSHASNRKLEIEHLELAKRRNAYILDIGDLFDAMQGKYDPRRNYPEMRPEYIQMMSDRQKGYLDVIVNDAIEFYKPYADRFLMIARGNHETAIQQHNDTDLIDRFVTLMNKDMNTNIITGGYGGWVRFMCFLSGTQQETFNLKYFHGSGGGGPVTKGTIQSNRQAVFLPDAHIVWNGHIHESWLLALPRERINKEGNIGQDVQYHLRTATYKNDYEDGFSGWHVQRGAPPKPMGCVWMRLYRESRHMRFEFIQDVR